MKAMIQDRFGAPDVLRLADIARPEPLPGEVLLRMHAAALNPYDWHMVRGDPLIARLMPGAVGLTKPRHRVAGLDAAGRVEAVGPDVRELRVGDEVLGFCPGAFAEYACATAEQVVPKPPSLTFEEAAAIPIAATTALRAIRDVGQVQSGHRVLINGAAGGVGTYAVQIARALGAEVTGVCGTASSELVLSLGASQVIDYTADDFTSERARYDVILDNAGSQPLGRLRHALKPGGTLVLNAGGEPGHVIGPIGSMIRAAAVNRFVGQRLCFLPTKLDRAELASITELIADGKLRSVIDRTYSLADTAEGLRYVEAGHAHGKVVVTIA
jgi:NADPH:quinone reductase-like Zn-dependent oxidoreductase